MTGTNKLFAIWKNQVSLAQSLTLAGAAVDAAARTEGLFELSVCPAMTALASVARECADKVATTAQNMGWDDPRSLTGETSATDLTDLGCRYVIIGHSERRLYLAETNDMIARKLRTAFAHRLAPILCLGDSLEEHRAGRPEGAVRSQLEVLLRLYQPTHGPFLIAHEPAWAISTSENAQECTPLEAADRQGFIRSVITGELGADLAAGTTLLYGGSVTDANIDAYLTRPDIDGALVGTASQQLTTFQALINATITTYRRMQPGTGPIPPSTQEAPVTRRRWTRPSTKRGGAVVSESAAFRVGPVGHVDLTRIPTTVKPRYTSHKDYKKQLKKDVKKLSALQRLHYASGHWSLLVIFQGMDAAGKDGAIRHVMSGVNPQGCQVFSFKQPTAQELDHDFLWRTTRCLPERGRIGIFNRSYYEDVLIARVHPEILHGSRLPDELINEKAIWEQRYQSIVDLEKHLHRNGTQIVKIFLHLSKDEQAQRFRARIDAQEKNWKFSLADIHERSYWDSYMTVYGDCLSATSTKRAPWYVVPADDKHNARLIISQILLHTLGDLKMSYPATTDQRHQELESFRSQL